MELVKKKKIEGYTLEILRDEARQMFVGQVAGTDIEEEAKTEDRLIEKVKGILREAEVADIQGFRVLIWKTKDGTYMASAFDILGCVTEGKTREAARDQMRALIFDALLQLAKDSRIRPPKSKVTPISKARRKKVSKKEKNI